MNQTSARWNGCNVGQSGINSAKDGRLNPLPYKKLIIQKNRKIFPQKSVTKNQNIKEQKCVSACFFFENNLSKKLLKNI